MQDLIESMKTVQSQILEELVVMRSLESEILELNNLELKQKDYIEKLKPLVEASESKAREIDKLAQELREASSTLAVKALRRYGTALDAKKHL